MLDSIQKHSEQLLKHPGALAITALGTAALTTDFFLGTRESHTRRSMPEFFIASPAKSLGTIALARGCQTDGKNYLRQVRRRARGFTVVGSDYGKRGPIGGEEFCEGMGKSLKEAGAERPSFVCQSMGGIAIMREFVDYADQTGLAEELGGLGRIVLDSSPFDRSDVRGRYRALLVGATAFHYNWSLDHLKLKVCETLHKPGADAHLDTIHHEGKYMRSLGDPRPLPAIMEGVIYINSPYDNVINSDQAAAKYEAITPEGRFMHVVDTARESPSHAARDEHLDTLIELATTEDIVDVFERRKLQAVDAEESTKSRVSRADIALAS